MGRKIMLAGVTVAALVAGTSAQTAACVLASDGSNPLVDLNALHNQAADYQLVSGSNDAYTYYFNVCGETNFQDSNCASGSTLCEVKDGAALDVFGYLPSISVARKDGYIVLSQTGQAQCPFNTANPYTSRIYFQCSDTTTITLKTEYYYQCLLEFEFLTPLACGGNAVHYRCDSESYQCVQDDSGRFESWADCSSGCVAPTTPPPTSCSGDACFACTSSFQCEASEYGHFTSQEACSSMCSPWVARYSCWGGRCVRNTRGNFTSEADCVTACAPTTASASDVHKTENRWSCSQGICTENGATGEFGSEADCESSCGSLDGNVEPVADV
eukprot:m.438147 g.438147  ORF g.438147 m.438147 type:complete len:329 (+) comp18200_c0_seq1:70-1056(+)